MRILLISTYELGHQPLHVASPAGSLLRAGHEVRCLDLAVEPLDSAAIEWADAVACSVPMHTACRLALSACAAIRNVDVDAPLCLYGLYAHLAESSAEALRVDLALSGEYEPGLIQWVEQISAGGDGTRPPGVTRSKVELGRGRFGLPARHLLPELAEYAHLSADGELHLAGYVEASHGCAHRCRHCPVPVVYDGRTRLVGVDALLADVAQLVEMGARHITFGDPDFLNGPHHALRAVRAVNGSFPELTFDVTAKVEHVLAHRELWPQLAAAGCIFVVSAFESTSTEVLSALAKGHSPIDEVEAVAVLRSAGIEPRPSFLPFTPWTTADDMVELLELVDACDLVGNVDPVQFAIRLLVPPGSLLLSSGDLEGHLGPYDPDRLSWSWRSGDPRLDLLAERISRIAELSLAQNWTAARSFDETRDETFRTLGFDRVRQGEMREEMVRTDPTKLRSPMPTDERPRLTESWFCCAEPTDAQFSGTKLDVAIGASRK